MFDVNYTKIKMLVILGNSAFPFLRLPLLPLVPLPHLHAKDH